MVLSTRDMFAETSGIKNRVALRMELTIAPVLLFELLRSDKLQFYGLFFELSPGD